jgi:hypothetical protein
MGIPKNSVAVILDAAIAAVPNILSLIAHPFLPQTRPVSSANFHMLLQTVAVRNGQLKTL